MPELAHKIKMYFALAPIATVKYAKSPGTKFLLLPDMMIKVCDSPYVCLQGSLSAQFLKMHTLNEAHFCSWVYCHQHYFISDLYRDYLADKNFCTRLDFSDSFLSTFVARWFLTKSAATSYYFWGDSTRIIWTWWVEAPFPKPRWEFLVSVLEDELTPRAGDIVCAACNLPFSNCKKALDKCESIAKP